MRHIKIDDIAYVRFAAPDLDKMRKFLEDFGLVHIDSNDGKLYMRGSASAPFLHATEQGEPQFLALGLRAKSEADLDRLATAIGGEVTALDSPGGGKVVRLQDPDGHKIEVVAGQKAEPLQELLTPLVNNAGSRPRIDNRATTEAGPAQVLRLGHAVLEVTDYKVSQSWYYEHFGLLISDEIETAPDRPIGAFMRCDRGDTPTDHHTLFLLQSGEAKFNHAAFEVGDVNDVMKGHEHLKAAGHEAAWGVGRHILGSQIFDYWKDPWGHELEHWTDGDLFTADVPPAKNDISALLGVQWGDKHPMMRASEK